MSLLADDIKKIAHLARVGINDENMAAYAHDLSNLLGLMTQMGELDTEGVKPMAHPLDLEQRLRPDTIIETNQREKFQTLTPHTEKGLYLVPKVID
ncbi:MAG: Asp-tRNA(Asn)/Glu-tRNA(Gln) amidotransferase subunit GatC [Methylococcales bacterium]|nr:Asp-tRNA(Asn)/Glu-tRNA(Gln) amidotransferase subunit GatC [Methylococcales bacterium]